jgi:hypothetical protein
MAENEVIIEVSARLDKAEAAIRKFEGQAEKSGEKAGKGFSAGLTAAVAAATAAVAALGVTLSKSITAAIEQENALNELNAALARTGQFSKEVSADFDAFSDQLERNSLFAGDVILSNAALIQSLGKLSADGLKQATQASADLAAALGVDLRTASQLVGKAAAGEVGTFGRYGIAIKEGATNAETFANALAVINRQFGGAAAAQVNTFSGQVTQLKNSFGKLLEEIGNVIIKSPAVVGGIRFISERIRALTAVLVEFAKNGGFTRILETGLDVARFFTIVLGPVIELIIKAFQRVGMAIGGVAAAIAALFSGNFAEAGSIIVDTFKEVGTQLIDTFKFEGTRSAVAFIDGFKESVSNAPPVAQEFKNTVQAEVETFSDISWNGFIESFRMSVAQMNDLAKGLLAQLKTTVVNGVGGAFQAIGSALVKGENAFAAFGKAILGLFGDIAIQLGTFYLTLGFANLFLNPAAASTQLAGGAALLVLGGALKALAGGGGGSSASSPAGGGAGAGPAESAVPTQLQEPEAQAPGTAVTVNVQGNILDRRQTGLEIAEAINEAFSTDGLVIARGAIV